MAKVMKARLESSTIGALHASAEAQLVEDSICGPSCDRTSITANEEWHVRLGQMSFAALTRIGGERVDKIWAER
jgi:hypothetical protein